uniref:Putative secreted protein n=1 Tax=Anopheles darlingi TaxID=43151 RepID=A0A2M4D0W5_ANODA
MRTMDMGTIITFTTTTIILITISRTTRTAITLHHRNGQSLRRNTRRAYLRDSMMTAYSIFIPSLRSKS